MEINWVIAFSPFLWRSCTTSRGWGSERQGAKMPATRENLWQSDTSATWDLLSPSHLSTWPVSTHLNYLSDKPISTNSILTFNYCLNISFGISDRCLTLNGLKKDKFFARRLNVILLFSFSLIPHPTIQQALCSFRPSLSDHIPPL